MGKPHLKSANISKLSAVDLSYSTGEITIIAGSQPLTGHFVIIDGNGHERWSGQITGSTQTQDTWAFGVFCVCGGHAPHGARPRGLESVNVTVISPDTTPVPSDPVTVPNVQVD